MTQLVEQITNNTTNTTNIDNRLKAGFDSLLKATANLPNIAAGIAIVQTNITLLSDIRGELQFIRSDSTQVKNDQARTVAKLDQVIESLTSANRHLSEIGTASVAIPGILVSLVAIQADVRRIAERNGPDPSVPLARIIAQLEAIEKNTRGSDDERPPPLGERPPPPKEEPVDPILRCMRSGLHVYFMGPPDSVPSASRCMTQDSWEKTAKSYSWRDGNELIKSIDQRDQLCQAPPERRLRLENAQPYGGNLSAEYITWLLLKAKDAKLPRGIRLAGAVIYDPLSLADVETNVPLAIEYATFCKEVHFDNLNISRELSFDGSMFLKDLTFANSTLGENLHLRKALTRKVSFPSTTVNGEVDFSETVATRVWSFVGATIGQMAAAKADLRDLDMTDSEIKRRFSADGIRIRNTFLLQGSKVGSDLDLTNARLTHTTIRRATIQSDLRLKNVDARCSTKVHKSKIDGDIIIEEYRFGAVQLEKAATPGEQPVDGKFQWALTPPKPSAIELPEETLRNLYKIDTLKENAGDEAQQIEASSCAIVTPKKDDKPEHVYRSSGVLDLVDSAVGGSVCVNDLTWQRGLQRRLRSRSIDDKHFDPQNVLSFNGTSVAKYTILGLLEHPKDPPDQKSNPARSEFARLQLIGFKTNGLMLHQFKTADEYGKVVSRLDIEAVLKAQAGCPLDDIGFSRTKARSIDFADILGGATAAPSSSAQPRGVERTPGADFPSDQELLAWISDIEPKTTQPYAAFIAALTRSGIDPIELRISKSWLDLGAEWQSWKNAIRLRGSGESIDGYSLALFNQATDAAQIGVRAVHGGVSGFGLRPARSLGIIIVLIFGIWVVLRLYHGRIAYLAVPTADLKEAQKLLSLPETFVPLGMFEDHKKEWRIITLPTVVRMTIPHALTSVPLLGSMFDHVTFDWSTSTIIGFRRGSMVQEGELAGTPIPPPSHWDGLDQDQHHYPVELPAHALPLSYLGVKLRAGLEQVRQLSNRSSASTPSTAVSNLPEIYLPGLIGMPQSGRLLASLKRWSKFGFVVTAILLSGLIALFKF